MHVRVSRPFPSERARHSGCFIQSDFGLGNYEMLVCLSGARLTHFWRDSGDQTFPWHVGHVYSFQPTSDDAAGSEVAMSEPIGVSLIRSSIQGDGRHGNFDAVVRLRPRPNFDGQGDQLSFCAFDTRTMQWTPVTPIIADGRPIEGITGTPALVQCTFGTVGNYEMLVPAGSELRHYWRNNDDPNFA